MAGEPALLAHTERIHRALAALGDHRMDLLTPAAARDVVVFLAQSAPSAQQRALHHRHADAQLARDLLVRVASELAQCEHAVLLLGETLERAVQGGQPLTVLETGIRCRLAGHQAIGRGLGLEGNLLGALPATGLVDTRVLGDLVQPRLDRDRALALAHAPQSGDEDLLSDVLRAAVVADHPQDVGEDPPSVTSVQLAECPLVAPSNGTDKLRFRAFWLWVRRSYR